MLGFSKCQILNLGIKLVEYITCHINIIVFWVVLWSQDICDYFSNFQLHIKNDKILETKPNFFEIIMWKFTLEKTINII
jgi:hypothetical protein